MSYKKKHHLFNRIIFRLIQDRMSWNIGGIRNLFLKLKSKLGRHQAVLATPKTSHEKFALTLVKMQQLPNIEKTHDVFRKTSFFPPKKDNIMVGGKYVRTSNLLEQVECSRVTLPKQIYLKDSEVDLKLTEQQSLSAKWVSLSNELHSHILQAVHCTWWNISS